MSKPEQSIIKIPFQITVRELAARLDLVATEVIKKLMENGIVATINETIDYETAVIISEELGFKTEQDQEVGEDEITLEKLAEIIKLEQEDKDKLTDRAPIVTILGHVDHGKTTLLDTLKKTRLAEEESGGITQHISAYQVKKNDRPISFIDTPGHEAFQSMRERGASIADIAVLVVAADDGVKPQTKEVIKHLLENKIPTVVAINKIDKSEANPNKVKQELAENSLLLEGYGGDVPSCEISAKQNLNLDDLLETILLVADVQEFKSDFDRPALAIVLEAHKDPQKGPVCTVLIKTGTLKQGQDVLVGQVEGRVRKIEDYAGKSVKQAVPATPVTIIGLSSVPNSSDVLQVLDKEKARSRRKKKTLLSQAEKSTNKVQSAASMIQNIDRALSTKYPVILKADVQGTLEAVNQILGTIKSKEVFLEILKQGVGPITETDIQAAQTSGAMVYGFNVFPTAVASRMAQNMTVPIKTFQIIYELVEDVKNGMSDLLPPEIKRTDLGRLKVLAIFKNMKKGMVVGGKVTNGKMEKNQKIEIIRDKEAVDNGDLTQLQHNKEDVKEVKTGSECGISFGGKEKIMVGDTLVCYKEEEIKRKID